jgi:hypothetical protein
MDAIRTAASSTELERVLVVAGRRRARDLVELRDRVVHRWPDRVQRGDGPGELVVDTGRRWFVVRTVRWPEDFLDPKWRPQLVVVDLFLPFAVLNRLRPSPRRQVLPW